MIELNIPELKQFIFDNQDVFVYSNDYKVPNILKAEFKIDANNTVLINSHYSQPVFSLRTYYRIYYKNILRDKIYNKLVIFNELVYQFDIGEPKYTDVFFPVRLKLL